MHKEQTERLNQYADVVGHLRGVLLFIEAYCSDETIVNACKEGLEYSDKKLWEELP